MEAVTVFFSQTLQLSTSFPLFKRCHHVSVCVAQLVEHLTLMPCVRLIAFSVEPASDPLCSFLSVPLLSCSCGCSQK